LDYSQLVSILPVVTASPAFLATAALPAANQPVPFGILDLALRRTAQRGTTRLLVHNISSYNVRSFQFDAQEEELIFGINRLFSRGGASCVPWAAAILAAFAILAPASNAQTATPAPTSAKTAAPAHKHAAADPAPSAAPVKTIGNKNAPISMEVFSDYQCPSCGSFFENTLRAMIQDYVANGKVYLVHHDFPLQMHTYSGQAARWSNAAGMIGQFQDVDAALFDSQAKWPVDGNIEKFVAAAVSPANFKRMQGILKGCTAPPPTSKADRSVPQPEAGCPVDAYIVQDIVLGYQVPVSATPTFIIHHKGQSYPASSGIISWPILKQFFDSLLSQ
jgi:protein-disulfide isomerase